MGNIKPEVASGSDSSFTILGVGLLLTLGIHLFLAFRTPVKRGDRGKIIFSAKGKRGKVVYGAPRGLQILVPPGHLAYVEYLHYPGVVRAGLLLHRVEGEDWPILTLDRDFYGETLRPDNPDF